MGNRQELGKSFRGGEPARATGRVSGVARAAGQPVLEHWVASSQCHPPAFRYRSSGIGVGAVARPTVRFGRHAGQMNGSETSSWLESGMLGETESPPGSVRRMVRRVARQGITRSGRVNERCWPWWLRPPGHFFDPHPFICPACLRKRKRCLPIKPHPPTSRKSLHYYVASA